jgi:hypothetical protein
MLLLKLFRKFNDLDEKHIQEVLEGANRPTFLTLLKKSHKIMDFYTEWSSICCSITSILHNVAIFEGFVKEKNDYDETCYDHDLLLYQNSFT